MGRHPNLFPKTKAQKQKEALQHCSRSKKHYRKKKFLQNAQVQQQNQEIHEQQQNEFQQEHSPQLKA